MEKKILLIEDDAASLKLLQHSLIQHGYEVLIASNGPDGLRQARKDKPDLVILSAMLPGIDGFEVCHRLRMEGDGLPIVMLAEKTREADRATAFKIGVNEYLIKPVAATVVIGVVDDLMTLNSVRIGSAGVE
ncbi:MAG: response regulator transcription factor [Promethearchaeota archaeon]